MAYEMSNGTSVPHARNHYDLFNKLRTFVEATLPSADRWVVQRVDVGMVGTVSTITRVGTLATVTTSASHTMTGTVNIEIAGATDALYNGIFSCTVINATQFTYTMSGTPAANASGPLVAIRQDYDHQVIWKFPGLSYTAASAGYAGIKTYQSVASDYYNIKVAAMTGYVVGNTFETQPGISGNFGVPMWNQAIPYIFVANAQRVIVVVNIQNNWNSFYLGKFLPYATPSQYPYPVLAGGMFTSAAATRYDNPSYSSWWKGNAVNCAMRFVDGTYRNPEIISAPFYSSRIRNTNNDSGAATGYYGLHSMILSENIVGFVNNYGELDGIYSITGYNNAVENTLVVDGVTYVVIRDVTRTTFSSYAAVRLS